MNDWKNILADKIDEEVMDCSATSDIHRICHANEIINFVEKEIKKAEERGKTYWEPSEHHKEIWNKEGYDKAIKECADVHKNDDEIAFDNGYLKALLDVQEKISEKIVNPELKSGDSMPENPEQAADEAISYMHEKVDEIIDSLKK